MNEQFNKPKGFGDILDFTFRLAKNRFVDFFFILLFLIGPIYLIQAIILLIGGTSFFREDIFEGFWYEQVLLELESTGYVDASMIGLGVGYLILLLLGAILLPVAQGAIILAVNHIRKNEEFTVGSVIKAAFVRFFPLLGSSILFGLILFGLAIIPFFITTFLTGFGVVINPVVGVLLGIVLFLGCAVGYIYLMARWSFYFASVTLKEGSPGFGRSWRLTSKRTWVIIGLYIIFMLIIMSVSYAVEFSVALLLGGSVLQSMIVNIVTLLTTMIFSIGYAVMYFDLKLRYDADDLKEMIEEYK
ncbi:hypothetical protein CHH83_17575 [Bacillus sp. 7586-K]|nr:hypothetical protein CHH83_17575 [Bacillus sp. 7586-K]